MDRSQSVSRPEKPATGGRATNGGSTPGEAIPIAQADGSAFRILAASSLADERTRVLKHGDTFGVFDHYGDIKPGGLGEEGLYHDGTRFLSGLLLDLEGGRPFFLSSTVRDENDQLRVSLTNPDFLDERLVRLPLGTLEVSLTRFLWNGVCYQQLQIRNYGLQTVETSMGLHFTADFADIFEVRGMRRKRGVRICRRSLTGKRSCLRIAGSTASCGRAGCISTSRRRGSRHRRPIWS